MAAAESAAGDLPKFSKAKPEAYYLGESWEELATLSDAVLVAAGVALQVHSQVISATEQCCPLVR